MWTSITKLEQSCNRLNFMMGIPIKPILFLWVRSQMTVMGKIWFYRKCKHKHNLAFGRYQLEIFTNMLYLMINYINTNFAPRLGLINSLSPGCARGQWIKDRRFRNNPKKLKFVMQFCQVMFFNCHWNCSAKSKQHMFRLWLGAVKKQASTSLGKWVNISRWLIRHTRPERSFIFYWN